MLHSYMPKVDVYVVVSVVKLSCCLLSIDAISVVHREKFRYVFEDYLGPPIKDMPATTTHMALVRTTRCAGYLLSLNPPANRHD